MTLSKTAFLGSRVWVNAPTSKELLYCHLLEGKTNVLLSFKINIMGKINVSVSL